MLHSYDIVGAYFRQRDGESPAQTILEHIGSNTPLIIRANPTNPVDPNAIAVWIKTKDIPRRKNFLLGLASSGWEEDVLFAREELPLGYIPAKDAKNIKLPPSDIPAKLIFSLDGKCKVSFNTQDTFSSDLDIPF